MPYLQTGQPLQSSVQGAWNLFNPNPQVQPKQPHDPRFTYYRNPYDDPPERPWWRSNLLPGETIPNDPKGDWIHKIAQDNIFNLGLKNRVASLPEHSNRYMGYFRPATGLIGLSPGSTRDPHKYMPSVASHEAAHSVYHSFPAKIQDLTGLPVARIPKQMQDNLSELSRRMAKDYSNLALDIPYSYWPGAGNPDEVVADAYEIWAHDRLGKPLNIRDYRTEIEDRKAGYQAARALMESRYPPELIQSLDDFVTRLHNGSFANIKSPFWWEE